MYKLLICSFKFQTMCLFDVLDCVEDYFCLSYTINSHSPYGLFNWLKLEAFDSSVLQVSKRIWKVSEKGASPLFLSALGTQVISYCDTR